MGGKHNPVAGFKGQQALKNSGSGGVGGRHNTRNHADRFRHFAVKKAAKLRAKKLKEILAEGVVVGQNTASFGVFVFVVNVFGRELVFNYFIFHYAHA
mgnify:CR=1 FL=1